MVKQQGSKQVDNVTEIDCRNQVGDKGMMCRVVAKNRIPTRYRNIEEVDTDNVKLEDQEVEENTYRFNEPVDCEIVFGEELNRIECKK